MVGGGVCSVKCEWNNNNASPATRVPELAGVTSVHGHAVPRGEERRTHQCTGLLCGSRVRKVCPSEGNRGSSVPRQAVGASLATAQMVGSVSLVASCVAICIAQVALMSEVGAKGVRPGL